MTPTMMAFCLLTVFVVTTEALKFGIPSRLFSQLSSPKVMKAPTVERNLEPITVDQSRQLMDISDSNFNQNVINQEGLTVVLFTSSWCTPCRAMQKNLGEVMGNYVEKSRFCSIDTDHNPDSAAQFQDEKYDIIADELKRRGWRNIDAQKHPALIWTNLAKVDFHIVAKEKNIVNHLRGSQNLSNKALLSYHVATSKCENTSVSMPLQWSAAYEGLSGLIGVVTLNALFCLSTNLIEQLNQIVPSSGEVNLERENNTTKKNNLSTSRLTVKQGMKFDFNDQIEIYKNIITALKMDKEWLMTSNAALVIGLINILAPLSSSIFARSIATRHTKESIAESESHHMGKLSCISSSLSAFLRDNESEFNYTSYGGSEDIWIIKPVGLSCGERIVCTRNLLGVLTAAKALLYKCVVQKYIERPLLVRRTRKFDIRQWVLVTSTDPLVLYGFSECYLRLSGEAFSLSSDSLSQPAVHLCNHAIQKHNKKGDVVHGDAAENEESCQGTDDCVETASSAFQYDTMMSQQEFEDELQKMSPHSTEESLSHGIFITRILPKIKIISRNVLLSVRDKVEREGKGFEWLGLDLMVVEREVNEDENEESAVGRERDFELLLLEVNVSPDISLSTPVTERLVRPAVRDLFHLLLGDEGDEGHGQGVGALDDPVAAAARECPRNGEYLKASRDNKGSRDCSSSSSSSSKDSSLRWDLWHVGSAQGKRKNLAFSRAKQDCTFLGSRTDYQPRNVGTAERVLEILRHSSGGGVEKCVGVAVEAGPVPGGTVAASEAAAAPAVQSNDEDEDEI